MARTSSNTMIILEDDDGPFIRLGATKFRPPEASREGLRRGQTVKAWPVGHELRVELKGQPRTWGRN